MFISVDICIDCKYINPPVHYLKHIYVSKYPSLAGGSPCPQCGAKNWKVNAVANEVSATVWYKPWTWGSVKLEAQ